MSNWEEVAFLSSVLSYTTAKLKGGGGEGEGGGGGGGECWPVPLATELQ